MKGLFCDINYCVIAIYCSLFVHLLSWMEVNEKKSSDRVSTRVMLVWNMKDANYFVSKTILNQ